MDTNETRLARLEERVFNSQAGRLIELAGDMKELSKKLNWLILVLAANFGVGFLKLFTSH